MTRIKNILVPLDFSEASKTAARFAATLAQIHGARIYALHVKEPFPVHGRIMAGFLEDVQKHRLHKEKDRLAEVIPAKLKGSNTVKEIQVTGTPVARVIVEMAKKLGVDVIVLASKDRKGLMRFFKKDLAQRVLRDASCSVFVIRCPGDKNTFSDKSRC